jgi:hypothetical protein
MDWIRIRRMRRTLYKVAWRVAEADCWMIDHAGIREKEIAANRLFWQYIWNVEGW